ncbi:response regulator [Halobacteriovorax sp. HLS]|uniref:response regulator n=1 Tax=Halobacteriovorax sp. HLS TaxID=2234000 RepID=UPI000FD89656|nr:response regulator [Halobacteriovorax sp. HLS]
MIIANKSKNSTFNVIIFITLVVALITMFTSLVKISKKVDVLNNVGKVSVIEQQLLINQIQQRIKWWHKQIDFSIISEEKVKLDFKDADFEDFKNQFFNNHKKVNHYFSVWGFDANDILKFNKIKVLFSANTFLLLKQQRVESSEKLYLKRLLSDYGNSLSFYSEVLEQKHHEVIVSLRSEKELRNGLYITICGVFIIICFFSFVLIKQLLKMKYENSSKKYNVLFVDDDVEILEVLTSTNEKLLHCSFFQASDGIEALQIVATQRIDLIITDLSMPNMDGVELIKNLEKKSIPYIVMTSKVLLSEKVRKQLKGQHVFDKFDILYRMDEIIGSQLKFSDEDLNILEDAS